MMKRLRALIVKEFLQVRRDPSGLILSFLLPIPMILLFGFCVNLDTSVTRLALVIEDEAPVAHRLTDMINGSPNFRATREENRLSALKKLNSGQIHGMLFIPTQFSRQATQAPTAELLMATDGTVPNTAQFTAMYLQNIYARWQQELGGGSPLNICTVYRYNPAAVSSNFIIPGAITIVVSMISIFLTAMVVAREWERGTIETLFAGAVGRVEFVLAKLIPYFLLGLGSVVVCVLCAVYVFGVPLRGSLYELFGITSLFLLSVLSMGLLISTVVRNQYSASLLSLMVGLLPTMLLSGFVFELTSMPAWVQAVSYFIPARYFCNSLTPVFLAGSGTGGLFLNTVCLAVSALFWGGLLLLKTPTRLDS